MTLWFAVTSTTLACLVVIFRNRPPLHRGKPIGYIEHFIPLVANSKKGTLIFVEHEESGRFLQFRMATDAGGALHSIVFGFPDSEATREYFDAILHSIQQEGFIVHVHSPPGEDKSSGRYLEVSLCGNRYELGEKARHLSEVVAPVLGFDIFSTFSFWTQAGGGSLTRRRGEASCPLQGHYSCRDNIHSYQDSRGLLLGQGWRLQAAPFFLQGDALGSLSSESGMVC